MKPKTRDPLALEYPVSLHRLFPGETKFRFLGFSDNGVAAFEGSRVIADGQQVREARVSFEVIDMGDVVGF